LREGWALLMEGPRRKIGRVPKGAHYCEKRGKRGEKRVLTCAQRGRGKQSPSVKRGQKKQKASVLTNRSDSRKEKRQKNKHEKKESRQKEQSHDNTNPLWGKENKGRESKRVGKTLLFGAKKNF